MLAVIVLSCLVLIGWALDIETLKTVFPGMVAMNPGGTAWLSCWRRVALVLAETPRTRFQHRIGMRAGRRGHVWAVVRLAGYWLHWDHGPDQWLFPQKLAVYEIPNRMAPNTAINFLLVGLALLLLDVKFGRMFRPAEMLALAAALISLLAIIGYAYSAVSLIGIKSFIPMALNTAVTFAILSAGRALCQARRRPDGQPQQQR